jgi:molybdopterin converting factor subunit 1
MHITVRYFAGHRDITGTASETLDVATGTSMVMLWAELEHRYPALAPFRGRVLFARNQVFVGGDTLLTAGDTVAFIPPVSGGASVPRYRVGHAPLDATPLVQQLSHPGIGAVVTFAGTVRDHFGNRQSARLEYEAYTEMAEAVLADIGAEAERTFAIDAVAIHHRIGTLELCEVAVVVVVTAAHRKAALQAVDWIMDRIKEVAPIWKKEHWADGGKEWVGSEKERPAE